MQGLETGSYEFTDVLDIDFASVCMNIVEGCLNSVKFRSEASVCKYIVPKGYGTKPAKDATIVVNDSYRDYSDLYYAAVNLEETGEITTTSSRAGSYYQYWQQH